MWVRRVRRHLKSAGVCVIFAGGFWFFQQLRQISKKVGSAVDTNILQLEQSRAQYIYIDDPQLSEIAFESNVDLEFYIKKNKLSLSKKIEDWWKELHLSLARRLLNVAQNGDKTESVRAIFSLGTMKQLRDWHYQGIAQMLDAKTAATLARIPKVDLRFFLKPPPHHEAHLNEDIIEEFHKLLVQLNIRSEKHHQCLSQFLNKYFKDPHPDGWVFDHDLASVGLAVTPVAPKDQELLNNCIIALYHHSSIEKYSKDIIDANGLPVLMNIHKMFEDDINISILLAKILSNISLHNECLNDVFVSGWIGILVRWSQHCDMQLSATAGKALANLDTNAEKSEKFSHNIYLLHPLQRTKNVAKLDVVFVHGLLGGVFVTWRQRNTDLITGKYASQPKVEPDVLQAIVNEQPHDFLKDLALDLKNRELKNVGSDFEVILDDCPEETNCQSMDMFFCKGDDPCIEKEEHDRTCKTQCWPKDWLAKDVPHVRIIGIDYNTNLSMWAPLCPIQSRKSTIQSRSDEFTSKLVKAGVGQKPVIWVCHSMGGLIVKKMLIEEWKNNDKHNLCRNTKGIVFYSTPHRGSHVADLNRATKMLAWPSIEVQELREKSPELLKLHDNFLKLLENFNIDIVSFIETKPTLISAFKLPFQFVTSESAGMEVGEYFSIPQDHLTICKPAKRQSFLYQRVLALVKRYIST